MVDLIKQIKTTNTQSFQISCSGKCVGDDIQFERNYKNCLLRINKVLQSKVLTRKVKKIRE
jgi:hypothetical protein